MGQKLEKRDRATKTWRCFESLEEPKDALEKEDGEILDGNLVLFWELIVDGSNVATEGECRADECEARVWARGGDESERKVFKKEVDERGKTVYADMESSRDYFRKEKIVKEGEL